jgi:pimeloyl-ACP methyl ester carboxylesterase
MAEQRRGRVATNGVGLDLIEAGRQGDPGLVVAHGFRKSAHSWRYQIAQRADAGYHVLVPDRHGDAGSAIAHRMEYVVSMQLPLPDFRGSILVDDAGHWTQQQRPDAFNTALFESLKRAA